jgi:3-phosphoshikimate 1-carboxyvinyltransferase
VPGSKSETNRLLVLAALADAPTTVHNPLMARDTALMVGALQALGLAVRRHDTGLVVEPGPIRAPADIDVGLAGTVMRFLPPVAALADGPVRFDGDPRARQRPMQPLLQALRDLDVEILDDGRGALPFTVRGRGRVTGGSVSIDASGSSQFVSGLLLSGCRFDKGLDVRVTGTTPSAPHLAMTVTMLRRAGVDAAQVAEDAWRVEPGRPSGGHWTVAPDLSNAAPFLAAAMVAGGTVRIPGWAEAVAQPGEAVVAVLRRMGADCAMERDGSLVLQGGGHVHGVDVDLADLPELVTTVVALAALADSPTVVRGIAHLRGHETDRLAALAAELGGLGGDVTEQPDGLEVRPRPLHGGVFHTYADHRMATAGTVLGLAVPGVLVEDVATTAKTLPDFTTLWCRMLGDRAA